MLFTVAPPPARRPTLAIYRDGFSFTPGCSEPTCTNASDSAVLCSLHAPPTTAIFRTTDAPEHARFLREICEGSLPRELDQGGGTYWLLDQRTSFLPEPERASFEAFSGLGQMLGGGDTAASAVPAMAGAVALNSAAKAAEAESAMPLPRPSLAARQHSAPAEFSLSPAPEGDRERICRWPHPWRRKASQLLQPDGGCPLPRAPLVRQHTSSAEEDEPMIEQALPMPLMMRQVSNPYW